MINSRDIKDHFYVYLHIRVDTKEIFYIGKGTGDRAYRKNNRSKWWNNIVNKHDYIVHIVDEKLSEATAFELETFLISEIGRADLNLGPLINMTNGGDGVSGYKFTDEQRKALSDSHKGEKSHLFGKRGIDVPHFGRKQSEEEKIKRSNSLKGLKRSQDVKDAQSKRLIGRKLSIATKEKLSLQKMQKVECYTDSGFQKSFTSIMEASLEMNVQMANISSCCLGKRQSAGKHIDTKEKLRWRKIHAE